VALDRVKGPPQAHGADAQRSKNNARRGGGTIQDELDTVTAQTTVWCVEVC
jgi:hypothetical protein